MVGNKKEIILFNLDVKELGEREPYYTHFTKYFVCPIQRDRDNKLNQIGI